MEKPISDWPKDVTENVKNKWPKKDICKTVKIDPLTA